jgi:hypothetical protein
VCIIEAKNGYISTVREMKKAKSDESAGKKGPDRPKVGHT